MTFDKYIFTIKLEQKHFWEKKIIAKNILHKKIFIKLKNEIMGTIRTKFDDFVGQF